MRKAIIISALALSLAANAQRHEILSPTVASLTVVAGDDWMGMPVAHLDGEPINIDFDELSHEYHRYTYRIEHCEADWTPSEGLFASDYIAGFYDDNIIDDCAESVATYQDYTHYHLALPNEQCRLTMSGNYRLTIIDENNDNTPVIRACFMIAENSATITMAMRTNTDIDVNKHHQQIDLRIAYGSLNVTEPEEQLNLIVLQNQRWSSAVHNPRITMKMSNGQSHEHCRDLIFPAGNEYHKFETLDPTHTTMGLAAVGWNPDFSEWHAYVEPDYPRPNYVYDVDANGAFLIRNSDNIDNDTQSDYIITHFELHSPLQKSRVYLNAAWTNDSYLPQYEMLWNEQLQLYEAALPLKQGYYSYRYVSLSPDGTIANLATDGNFFETENSYQALLYYRSPTDRATRLVAFATLSSSR